MADVELVGHGLRDKLVCSPSQFDDTHHALRPEETTGRYSSGALHPPAA